MSFHLVHADRTLFVASDRAVIKRAERIDFADAMDLLQAAKAIRERAQGEAETAREAGYRDGLETARTEADAHLAEQIAGFAAALDAHEQARRGDIAEAAYAAVRAIVGEMDDVEVLPRIVERTLAQLPGEGPVTVLVAPVLAERVAARIGALEHVAVEADPALGAQDCVVRTQAGQVIAGLSVQLDMLAKRWGLDA